MPRKLPDPDTKTPETIESFNNVEPTPTAPTDKKPGLDHPTKHERRQRVELVYELMLQGKNEHFIIEFCRRPPKDAKDRKQWQVNRAAAYKYIADARAMLEADFADDRPKRINRARRFIGYSYGLAAQMKDHRSMLTAVKLEAELMGDLVVKHELAGKDGGPIDFEISQVKQRLLDKAKAKKPASEQEPPTSSQT